MTLDRVNEICRPYGLVLMPAPSQRGHCNPDSYTAYQKTDIENGVSYAFDVIKGTSEEELEGMAISWSLENSFR